MRWGVTGGGGEGPERVDVVESDQMQGVGLGNMVGGMESGWRWRRGEGSRSEVPSLARGPLKAGVAASI